MIMNILFRSLGFRLFACLTLIYGVLLLWPAHNQVKPIAFYQNQVGPVNNIAHGTGRELMPGNTLEGALNSVAVGADIIELDVHLTADKFVVVRHDETIDSTTNGSGLIAEMSLAQLQSFDVGFHKGDYPDKIAPQGIRIPTLESLFVALPDKRFLIELKPDDTETGIQLCALVEKHKLYDQVVVGSFHSSVLQRFRKVCPRVPTSLGEAEAQKLVILSWLGLGHLYKSPGYSVQLPFEYNGVKVVSGTLLRAAKKLNLRVDVWTVNNPEKMRELIALRVDGIITDRPDILQGIDI
jgi:glycerophosphoryl diester phosphodiesterase